MQMGLFKNMLTQRSRSGGRSGAVATREERRRAIEARRRRVRRQRRGLVAAAVIACLVAVLLVASSGGSGGSGTSGGHRATEHAAKPKPKPPAVDRVLAYTGYILRGSRHRREVALTFDDGPSPYTPQVLKVLRRRHAPGTFFPIGQAINADVPGLRRVRRSGFPIGDHTMTHPLMGHLPQAAQAEEIDHQARLLRAYAHAPYPRLFRPPDGSFDDVTRQLLARRRMLMVLWSVNPEDYFRPGADAIVERVLAGVRPGAIVLMHDGGGDRSQTVAALPKVIHALRARGYRLVTVPQMLDDAPPSRKQGPPPNLSGV
jgi:peptidoglycan/xylan/chitin deacetylase (PgdA/CDA1 family)